MSPRQVNIVVDSADPAAMARFWADLLHVPVDGTHVRSPELTLTFVPTREPKTVKNRVHLDLASQSPRDQDDIVSHALSLGAAHADIGQGDTPWVVLKDVEGNEFCVLEPRPEYASTGPVAAIVVDALTPATQAAAWSKITGRPITRATEDFASLRGPGPWLEFVRVAEPKVHRNRLRLAVGPPGRAQFHTDQDRELHRHRNTDSLKQRDAADNEPLRQRSADDSEPLQERGAGGGGFVERCDTVGNESVEQRDAEDNEPLRQRNADDSEPLQQRGTGGGGFVERCDTVGNESVEQREPGSDESLWREAEGDLVERRDPEGNEFLVQRDAVGDGCPK